MLLSDIEKRISAIDQYFFFLSGLVQRGHQVSNGNFYLRSPWECNHQLSLTMVERVGEVRQMCQSIKRNLAEVKESTKNTFRRDHFLVTDRLCSKF